MNKIKTGSYSVDLRIDVWHKISSVIETFQLYLLLVDVQVVL